MKPEEIDIRMTSEEIATRRERAQRYVDGREIHPSLSYVIAADAVLLCNELEIVRVEREEARDRAALLSAIVGGIVLAFQRAGWTEIPTPPERAVDLLIRQRDEAHEAARFHREQRDEAMSALIHEGHTEHCAARLACGDGQCKCGKKQ
jgi:hypothetical protein